MQKMTNPQIPSKPDLKIRLLFSILRFKIVFLFPSFIYYLLSHACISQDKLEQLLVI